MARSRRGRDQLAGAASMLLDDEAAEGGRHHEGEEEGVVVEGEGGCCDAAAAAARTRLGRRYTEEVGNLCDLGCMEGMLQKEMDLESTRGR